MQEGNDRLLEHLIMPLPVRDETSTKTDDRLGVFQRAFTVLEYVVRAQHPVAPGEIAESLGLPKPTVYRMIESFEMQGFLQRSFGSRRVGIGSRLTDFAFDVLRGSIQSAPRRTILNGLVAEVGETCNIGTLDGGEIVYLDRVEAKHWPLRLNFHIGSRVPLHCTAIGKLFLAFLPERQRESLLSSLDLPGFTAHTITEGAALEAELQRIAAQGLSIDREEYIAGVVCIAAPIFNAKREVQAGVAIQAPAARMTAEDAWGHRDALLEAARGLSQSLMLK
jgi:IclR family acetate operon transcriptional repressor